MDFILVLYVLFMKSVMSPQQVFSMAPAPQLPRSVFNRSHGYKTTLKSDLLVPFFVDDILPGDACQLSSKLFLRFNDLLRPFMDNLFMDTFYFFVPYRLVWKNWKKMCGEQDHPNASTDYLTPKMKIPGFARMPGSIFDYFGIPQIGQDLAAGVKDAKGVMHYYKYYLENVPGYPGNHFILNPYQMEAPYDEYNYAFFPNFVFVDENGNEIRYNDNGGTDRKPNTEWTRLATLPITVNSLALRAYLLIWREWFKDENLWLDGNLGPEDIAAADGPDSFKWFTHVQVEGRIGETGYTIADYEPSYRMKRHDYFTSCLPWPQKGPAVKIPVSATSGSVPVVGTGKAMRLTTISANNPDNGMNFYAASQGGLYDNNIGAVGLVHPWGTSPQNIGVDTRTAGLTESINDNLRYKLLGFGRGSGTTDPYLETLGGIYASIGGTINELRDAFAIQRMYEKDARGGTRYCEVLLQHFGVSNGDLVLNRPLYLGGSSERLNVMQIPQTSAATTSSPQGNLAAISQTVSHAHFQQSFNEFGVVIGLVNIRADLTYQNGLDRMWSKSGRFDYYWPSLAYLGEQAVLKKEISWSQNDTAEEVFGYQERWAEYRYKPSRITGFLNSNAYSSLDIWHLSQNLLNPTLSTTFIAENVPINRVTAVKSEFFNNPPFLLDVWHDYKCARVMPTYSVPGLVDHF